MKPVSQTAFYCCGVRMQDAESKSPLCGDDYARVFMNEEGLKILETFKEDERANISNVTRHRIIDDLLRRELLDNPALRIAIIGAGFDTRAYRLKGGSWVELDEPSVIAYKNERLPISECANELQRISIDFDTESPAEKLFSFTTHERIVIVIEGVLMYLDEREIQDLLGMLRRLFPKHKLICDLMSRTFFETYAKPVHGKIAGMGAPFKYIEDDPAAAFLESGYQQLDKISVVQKVFEFTQPERTEEAREVSLPSLPEGYDIYIFES